MGILDEQMTPEKAEIQRLENLFAQLKLGTVRTEEAMAQLGPGGERDQMAATLAQLQSQAGQAQQQLMAAGGQPNPNVGQQMNAQIQQMPPQAPQQGPQQGPPQGQPPGQVPGLLEDPAAAAGFRPTMTPQAMNELYAIMAAGADDPNKVGMNYVQRMQYNDMLKNQSEQQRSTMTDAQRARPIGGGYLGASGGHINPVWMPGANGKPGKFEYHEGPSRMPKTVDVGGVKYMINDTVPPGSPGWMVPAVGMADATDNARRLSAAGSLGTAQGSDQAGAQVLGGEMQIVDSRLANLIADENFAGGVGWLDQFTGKVGAQFGTKEGLITKEANYISNALTRSSVADWKGAISNAELNFFKDSVPQAGDGPEVWRQWHEKYYKPTMMFVNLRASGQLTLDNSSLSQFLAQQGGDGGGGSTYTDAEKAALREAGIEVD